MTSDFWGSFLTPLPPISDFAPILMAILHRDSPIFENLPPLPKIGYHLWTAPKQILYIRLWNTTTLKIYSTCGLAGNVHKSMAAQCLTALQWWRAPVFECEMRAWIRWPQFATDLFDEKFSVGPMLARGTDEPPWRFVGLQPQTLCRNWGENSAATNKQPNPQRCLKPLLRTLCRIQDRLVQCFGGIFQYSKA